ncbi:MAG: ROK family transcriptional regulator, partial [Mesorhizobium sp.]
LRGAAALAVSGVLSPRFGQIFTAERERGRDILQGKGIAA